ncbi:rhodanese-like domain-containing protein [Rothia mucilaginosa]
MPPNAREIVIYCTGYARTVEAAREIAPLEDRPVRMLEGGISAWLTV